MVPTLLPMKLETKESIAMYNAQRMLRQLGYDQGVVIISRELLLGPYYSDASSITF